MEGAKSMLNSTYHSRMFRVGVAIIACATALFLGGAGALDSNPPKPVDANQPSAIPPAKPPAGVFVLPLKGGLGEEVTAALLKEVVEEADKLGPGQTIVLQLDCPGGLATELFRFQKAIEDARPRHRVIAWVKKAVSGALAVACLCDDIYMTSHGTLGTYPFIGGNVDVQSSQVIDDMLAAIKRADGPWQFAEASVRPPKFELWARKNSQGITEYFHKAEQGSVQIAKAGEPLGLSATTALTIGVSSGTADTTADLASLLGMMAWREISDAGRIKAEAWATLYQECEAQVGDLGKRTWNHELPRSDRLAAAKALLDWVNKCRNCVELHGIDPDRVRRTVADLEAPRVFVLPMRGSLGGEVQAMHLTKVAAEADKLGPGQTIVLDIDCPGGLVTHLYSVRNALAEVRKRHRVVAWVTKANVAALLIPLSCESIFFAPEGIMRGARPLYPDESVGPDPRPKYAKALSEFVPDIVVRALMGEMNGLWMRTDPATGAREFFEGVPTDPSAIVLAAPGQLLELSASTAQLSGVSKGTAATKNEMAAHLGMKEWVEASDFGRKLTADWAALYKECEQDLDRNRALLSEYKDNLEARLATLEAILAWTIKCRPCTEVAGIDAGRIKELIADTKRQIRKKPV